MKYVNFGNSQFPIVHTCVIYGLLSGQSARADAERGFSNTPAIWLTLAFFNLVTWHGQVHELELVHSHGRGGADWRRIIVDYALLQPIRDSQYGFGTFYQRLFDVNICQPYTFTIYRLAVDDVPCLDFTPAHVIAIEHKPKVSEQFWDGWPPPPGKPGGGRQVVFKDPFATQTRRSPASGRGASRGGGGAIFDGGGLAGVAAPVEALPLPVPASAIPHDGDGEDEHGQDFDEENADQDCVGEAEMSDPILEALIGGEALRNSVPSDLDLPPPVLEPTVVCGPPAEEDESKARAHFFDFTLQQFETISIFIKA